MLLRTLPEMLKVGVAGFRARRPCCHWHLAPHPEKALKGHPRGVTASEAQACLPCTTEISSAAASSPWALTLPPLPSACGQWVLDAAMSTRPASCEARVSCALCHCLPPLCRWCLCVDTGMGCCLVTSLAVCGGMSLPCDMIFPVALSSAPRGLVVECRGYGWNSSPSFPWWTPVAGTQPARALETWGVPVGAGRAQPPHTLESSWLAAYLPWARAGTWTAPDDSCSLCPGLSECLQSHHVLKCAEGQEQGPLLRV